MGQQEVWLRAASGSRRRDLSTESSWCQRAPGPEVVPLHSYPRRGLTGKTDGESNVSGGGLAKEMARVAKEMARRTKEMARGAKEMARRAKEMAMGVKE